MAILKQQTGARVVLKRIELERAAARTVAGAADAGLNRYRPAELLHAGKGIERVQPLKEAAILSRPNQDVNRVGRGVDCRRGGNTNLRLDVGAILVRRRDRRYATRRIDEADLPENRAVIGVKGVKAVVFGHDIHDVVRASIDADAGKVEGLRVHIPVYGHRKEFPELGAVHIGLLCVRTCARVVVVLGGDVHLSVEAGYDQTEEATEARDQPAARQSGNHDDLQFEAGRGHSSGDGTGRGRVGLGGRRCLPKKSPSKALPYLNAAKMLPFQFEFA